VITIFAVPKAFDGQAATHQANAIASWAAMDPTPQIILFGNDRGTADAAHTYGADHVEGVRRNSFGTPLLDDVFARAQERAHYRYCCYVNADIILGDDLLRVLAQISLPRFLLVGRRLELDLNTRLDTGKHSAIEQLRTRARREGTLAPWSAVDYFVFPKGLIESMPPFPVGRAIWDNWMIFSARRRGIPVVDATDSVLAIHQRHDYSHVDGGRETVWRGVEVKRNWELVGVNFYPFTIRDATHRLIGGHVQRLLHPRSIARRLFTLPAILPYLDRLVGWTRRAKRIVIRLPSQTLGGRE
jgi:hypothetical protein